MNGNAFIMIYFGGVLRWGFTGTVFGPGFGLSGFGLGVGEGVDLLWGFTGTVLFAMICGYDIFALLQIIFLSSSTSKLKLLA